MQPPVDIALMVLGVAAFPVAALAMLLWLTHLEETLPRDVRSASRTPTPPPVLAVAVRQTEPAGSLGVERARQARPTGAQDGQAFSRSARLSLGGSTNR